MLNEISQTEKPMPHSLTYMWNLKKKIKLIKTELNCGYQKLGIGQVGEGEEWKTINQRTQISVRQEEYIQNIY